MTVQPASTLFPATAIARAAAARQGPAASPATPADAVRISQAARERLAADAGGGTPAGTGRAGTEFDTSKGPMNLDIDAYFTPPGSQGVDLDTLPLLAPTRRNIDTLSQHVAQRMPGFLAEHGIPVPPGRITYDSQGRIELPADYPHADAFRQALATDPTMERALRTTAALTSQKVEMDKVLPFSREYAAAPSQAAADAVVAKYRSLFSDHRHVDTIALNFTADGALRLTHDDRPLDAA